MPQRALCGNRVEFDGTGKSPPNQNLSSLNIYSEEFILLDLITYRPEADKTFLQMQS